MANILIADSGGTGTDWVFINGLGERSYFSTESYHPNNWSDSFWSRIENYWKAKKDVPKDVDLHFYGAGCYQKRNAETLASRLRSMEFQSVLVESDLHAAGKACLQNGSGYVAILGTGSVLFKFTQNQVQQIIGGKGHEIGDQGSGFYFGKLVLAKYQNNELTPNQKAILEEHFDVVELLNTTGIETKLKWSKLSRALKAYEEVFRSIHLENIDVFIETHFMHEVPKSISLVGSYAFHYQDVWRAKFASFGCEIDTIIQRPIEHLID